MEATDLPLKYNMKASSKSNFRKNITYVLVRFLIFIIPILILIGLMEFLPQKSTAGGHTDRGLGFAIWGGIWIIIFTFFLIIETIYRIFKKQNTYYDYLVIFIILAIIIIITLV